jgi:hypothetical protein
MLQSAYITIGGHMSLFDFISDIFSPSVNIDGTPMIQSTGLDTHGNPFGVTNDWLTDSTSSMFDSFSSSSMFDN